MSTILFISPQPIFGGAAVANIAIAKMLQSAGHIVYYNDEYQPEDVYNDVVIHHNPIHSIREKRNNRLIKLIDSINSENNIIIDTIIWGDASLFVFFQQALRFFSKSTIKQIAVFHSLCLERNLKSILIERIVAFSIRYIDYFVFVSDYTKKSWTKYRAIRKSNEKLVTIYNSISKASCYHTEERDLALGFVGRFSMEKQPEVFCRLTEVYRGNLIAFGEGPMLEDLKKQYPKVEFMGLERDIEKIYSKITILIVTSKFENCPMVILEAMARGIPTVAPRVGGIPEIIDDGENGLLYSDYSPESIISRVERIGEEYSNFSRNCIKKAECFYPSALQSRWDLIL